MYRKVFVKVSPIDDCYNEDKLLVDHQESQDFQFSKENIVSQFKGTKKKVVSMLIDGENLYQISKKLKVDKNKIYAMREELKDDLLWIYDDAKRNKYLKENSGDLDILVRTLKEYSKGLTLSQFANTYINEYNPEAKFQSWNLVPLQDVYYKVWQENSKSRIKAPREHLKTTSAGEYLVKRLFERDYPLDIIYLHKSRDIAVEKVRDIQMMIERNAILSAGLQIDQARNWKDGELRLLDGSSIYANAYGASLVGRHPHIIVLDDIIDQEVIFSDLKNDKAVRKFYSDIYPMITNAGEDKKIIIIGTAQREDDIYEMLPTDFATLTLDAIVDEDKKQCLEPALFSWETLMKVKKDMCEKFGERYWLKEYRNIPLSAMGEIVKPSWIKTYVSPPPLDQLQIYQGWDLGVGKDLEKGDYTAGATIGIRRVDGKMEIYVLEMVRVRAEFGDRLKIMASNGYNHKPLAIGVEQNVFQYDTVITLQKQTNLPIRGIKTVRNKVEKFQVELAPHFENGKVFIKADMLDLKNELMALPYGKHDDMCFVAGTKIATKLGYKNIEDLSIKDKIITPFGIRSIKKVGFTGYKKVINNLGLIGTPDHKVFQKNNGFIKLEKCYNESVSKLCLNTLIRFQYQKLLFLMEQNIDLWVERKDIISVSQKQIREEKILKDCTWRFGKILQEKGLKRAIQFIIKMVILLTMTLKIWIVFKLSNILKNIIQVLKEKSKVLKYWLNMLDQKLLSGTNQKKQKSFIKRLRSYFGKIKRRSQQFVLFAIKSFKHISQQELSSVLINADIEMVGKDMARLGEIEKKVYNLSVDNPSVYFANDVLVSNCDALTLAIQMSNEYEGTPIIDFL